MKSPSHFTDPSALPSCPIPYQNRTSDLSTTSALHIELTPPPTHLDPHPYSRVNPHIWAKPLPNKVDG